MADVGNVLTVNALHDAFKPAHIMFHTAHITTDRAGTNFGAGATAERADALEFIGT
jgi:hypothetical protein